MNNKKIKKFLFASALAMLFAPVAALAAWGGFSMDSNGNYSMAVGSGSGYGSGWALANPYGLPQGSILGIVSNFLFWLLSIFAILGIVGFVISGIIYLVSAGDDDMISRAKRAMNYSLIGIIVGLSGFLIMQAVSAFLNGGSASF